MRKKQPIEYTCDACGVEVSLPEYRYKKLKNKHLCGKCSIKTGQEEYKQRLQNDPKLLEEINFKKSEGLKKWHSNRSFEEKSKLGKYARSKVKVSGKQLRNLQQKFIDNASDDYYKKYCEKRREIALQFHASLSNTEKEAHYRKVFDTRGISKAANTFLDILEEQLKIELEREFFVKGFFCDALIKNTNIIVEFFGDVYHCNPKKFTDTTEYCSWISRTVGEQWKRDEIRTAALLRNGYNVIIVWENDWNTDYNKVLERIKNEMPKN